MILNTSKSITLVVYWLPSLLFHRARVPLVSWIQFELDLYFLYSFSTTWGHIAPNPAPVEAWITLLELKGLNGVALVYNKSHFAMSGTKKPLWVRLSEIKRLAWKKLQRFLKTQRCWGLFCLLNLEPVGTFSNFSLQPQGLKGLNKIFCLLVLMGAEILM